MPDTEQRTPYVATAARERSLPGRLVDYLRRGRATVPNVASHFGMTKGEARDALWSLEQQGRARQSGAVHWEAIEND